MRPISTNATGLFRQSAALWLASGCGSQHAEPPPLNDAATRAAIEEEDARVEAEESQQ